MTDIHEPGIKNVNDDILNPSATVEPADPWTQELTFDHYKFLTAPTGAGDLNLRLKPGAAHENGTAIDIFIPAGHADSLAPAMLAAFKVVSIDAFNAGTDMFLRLQHQSGRFLGTLQSLGLPDSTTPAIVSISASVDPANILTVVWNKPMVSRDGTAAGLATTRSVGGALSVSSLTSGNGTSSWVVALSGNVAPFTDVISLATSGTNIQDFVGNLLAPSSTSVHVPSALVDLSNTVLAAISKTAADVTPGGITNGADIATWVDRSPLANIVAAAAHAPTWIADTGSGTPGILMTSVAASEKYFKILNSPIDDTVNCCIAMLVNVQAETAGTGGLWSDDAPAGTGSALLTISGNFELDVNSTAPLTPVLSYDAWHLVIVYRRGTTWGISVDGVVTEHDYTTNQPTGIISFYIGAYFSNGTLQKGANMKVKVAFGMQRAPSSTELTYIRNAIHADFPSDTP